MTWTVFTSPLAQTRIIVFFYVIYISCIYCPVLHSLFMLHHTYNKKNAISRPGIYILKITCSNVFEHQRSRITAFLNCRLFVVDGSRWRWKVSQCPKSFIIALVSTRQSLFRHRWCKCVMKSWYTSWLFACDCCNSHTQVWQEETSIAHSIFFFTLSNVIIHTPVTMWCLQRLIHFLISRQCQCYPSLIIWEQL